jgi:hypothetical protein
MCERSVTVGQLKLLDFNGPVLHAVNPKLEVGQQLHTHERHRIGFLNDHRTSVLVPDHDDPIKIGALLASIGQDDGSFTTRRQVQIGDDTGR